MGQESRTCGECTACCKTHSVAEIGKPFNTWCPHVVQGKGCGIYEGRPLGCKLFKCEWLKGAGQSKDRPDKSRVVLHYVEPDWAPKGAIQIFEVMAGALFNPRVQDATKQYLAEGLVVVHSNVKGRKKMFIPSSVSALDRVELRSAAKKGEFEVIE